MCNFSSNSKEYVFPNSPTKRGLSRNNTQPVFLIVLICSLSGDCQTLESLETDLENQIDASPGSFEFVILHSNLRYEHKSKEEKSRWILHRGNSAGLTENSEDALHYTIKFNAAITTNTESTGIEPRSSVEPISFHLQTDHASLKWQASHIGTSSNLDPHLDDFESLENYLKSLKFSKKCISSKNKQKSKEVKSAVFQSKLGFEEIWKIVKNCETAMGAVFETINSLNNTSQNPTKESLKNKRFLTATTRFIVGPSSNDLSLVAFFDFESLKTTLKHNTDYKCSANEEQEPITKDTTAHKDDRKEQHMTTTELQNPESYDQENGQAETFIDNTGENITENTVNPGPREIRRPKVAALCITFVLCIGFFFLVAGIAYWINLKGIL